MKGLDADPQPGDQVRVTFEGVVKDRPVPTWIAVDYDGGVTAVNLNSADVELLPPKVRPGQLWRDGRRDLWCVYVPNQRDQDQLMMVPVNGGGRVRTPAEVHQEQRLVRCIYDPAADDPMRQPLVVMNEVEK